LQNRDSLEIIDDDHLLKLADEALEEIFTSSKAIVNEKTLKIGIMTREKIIEEIFKDQKQKFRDILHRKIRLKDLQMGKPKPAISISGQQIGNVVFGNVNLSTLNASLQNLKQKGQKEGELAQILENFLEVIKELEDRHQSEKNELSDLLNGLLTQLNVPKEGRSLSIIKVGWERIVQIGQTIHSVKSFLEQHPQILGLLQIGT